MKSTQSDLKEIIELVEIGKRQENGEREPFEVPPELLLLPLNVKREHSISDLLNPFETLPSVISIKRIVTGEDRMNLLGGPKEFLIRMYRAGVVPDNGLMWQLLNFIPLTVSVESSLLRLKEDTDDKRNFIETLYNGIIDRIRKRKDHAEAKVS